MSEQNQRVLAIIRTTKEMLADRGYQKIDVQVESQQTRGEEKDENIFEITGEHKVRKIDNYPEKILVEYKQECTLSTVKRIENNSVYAHCRYVLITDKAPNQTVVQRFRTMRTDPTKQLTVELFESRRMVFNVTHHYLVPKHTLLTADEKQQLLKDIKADESQLQTIEPNDPVAKYYGMLEGDVVMITRMSETAGKYVNFRICMEK